MNYSKMERITINLENDMPYGNEKTHYSIRFNNLDTFENVIADLTEKLKRIAKMNYLTSVCLTIEFQEDYEDVPFKRYTVTYDYKSAERSPMIEHRPYEADYSIDSYSIHKTNNSLIKTIINEIASIYNEISDKKETINTYLQAL